MTTLLGIDAGTTSLKAALFGSEGELLAVDRQEYQLVTPLPSRVELDPEVYWRACCRAIGNVVQRSGAWLNYGDMRLGQGRENAKKYLQENEDLSVEIKDKILVAKGLLETEEAKGK